MYVWGFNQASMIKACICVCWKWVVLWYDAEIRGNYWNVMALMGHCSAPRSWVELLKWKNKDPFTELLYFYLSNHYSLYFYLRFSL